MRHLIGLLLLGLLSPSGTWAMGNHSDVLRDQYGRAIGGATVTVYVAGTSTLATIYADNGVTTKTNPFLTNALDGGYFFYAANGVYDVRYSYPGITFDANRTKRLSVVDGSNLATSGGITSGATFPSAPSPGDLYILTSDSSVGACSQGGGVEVTLCRWDGTDWVALGGGGGGGSSGWPATLSGSAATSESAGQFLSIRGQGGQAANGADLYQSSTGRFEWVCVTANVRNECDYVRKLASGHKFEVQNASGTAILTVSNDTGAITNAVLNAEAFGTTLAFKRYRWFPAAGCNNTTASTIWDLPASNPAVAACRTGTNTTKGVLDFADGATSLTAQLTEYLHEDWTGAIEATILWESASTSTNSVVWHLALACAGSGESDDPAFTDDTFTADANLATANQYNLTAVNGITTTGTCSANKLMHIRVKRDPTNGSDTLAATARLVGVSLKLRESQ